jgi:hypothetical protein
MFSTEHTRFKTTVAGLYEAGGVGETGITFPHKSIVRRCGRYSIVFECGKL